MIKICGVFKEIGSRLKNRPRRIRITKKVTTELSNHLQTGQSLWKSKSLWLCKNCAPTLRRRKTKAMKNNTILIYLFSKNSMIALFTPLEISPTQKDIAKFLTGFIIPTFSFPKQF